MIITTPNRSRGRPGANQQLPSSAANSNTVSLGMTQVSVAKSRPTAAVVTAAAEEEDDSQDEPEYPGIVDELFLSCTSHSVSKLAAHLGLSAGEKSVRSCTPKKQETLTLLEYLMI